MQPGNHLDGVFPKWQLWGRWPALGQTSNFKCSARPRGEVLALSAPGYVLLVSILYRKIETAFIRHQLQ